MSATEATAVTTTTEEVRPSETVAVVEAAKSAEETPVVADVRVISLSGF